MEEIQPFQGNDFSVFAPRVARSSQPWAESFNPYGIAVSNNASQYFCRRSTERADRKSPRWYQPPPSLAGTEGGNFSGDIVITRNISLVKKKAFSGEKGLDTISPIW
jgi:hypothetical protein